jgi:hypothetical protein
MAADDIDRWPGQTQQHYTRLSLRKDPGYDGPCENHTDRELMAGLAEFMRASGLPHDLPLPPVGLPGHLRRKPNPAVMDIIKEAVRYLSALSNGEKKTLWNVHDWIDGALRTAFRAGADAKAEQYLKEMAAQHRISAAEAAKAEEEIFVYFIHSESGGIKIGMAQDIDKRLRGLQTAHPAKLTLMASCLGGQPVEREYHKRFAEHRLHGEWFSPAPEILAEIDRLSSPSHPREIGGGR